MHFHKPPPKVLSYRDFKKFENERFMDSLYLALNSQNIDYTKNPELFFNICQNELNHQAPREKNYIRGNNKLFMTKTWHKSIVKRKPFRNRFLKNLRDQNRLAFTKQRKFCAFLLEKKKSNILQN